MQKTGQKVAKTIHNVSSTATKLVRKKLWVPPTRRIDIKSSFLCDNLIKSLAPSLEKYKQCDIIDLNPGLGCWSSKVNQFLQPRSHILVEAQEQYMQNLQPLLDAPGSAYKLVSADPFSSETYQMIDKAGYLPRQPRELFEDVPESSSNSTLLCLVNIGSKGQVAKGKPTKSYSALYFRTILQAMLHRDLFQSYGRVRTLVWMTDSDKSGFIPRVRHHRTTKTILADMALESIREVAGLPSSSETSADLTADNSQGSESRESTEQNGELVVTKDEVDGQQDHHPHVPLLQWNRRSSDPEVVRPSHFKPQIPLTLLDLYPREDRHDWMKDRLKLMDVNLIIQKLFERPQSTLPAALERLAPGASEALIPQLHSMKHIANTEKLEMRSLPKETTEEIFDAWFQWSLRLTGRDLLSFHGNVSYRT